MESYLIYFAKVNGLLILFYLMYVLFLKKETFFTSNRWYLIAGLVLSLILPLMTFTKTIWVAPAPISENNANFVPIIANQLEIPLQETAFDWSLLLTYAYLIVSIGILSKIGMELISFFNSIQKQTKQKESNYTLVNSNSAENPFSFFHYIVINKQKFTAEELQHILTHESIHVKQNHSFDVLLAKVFCGLFWINPIIWFYRKAMLQNLEFIADKETIQQIENKYQYQITLLKVVTHQHNLSITNQFYQSLIKKRIVMLHTNQSHKRNVLKYAFILPVLVGFMLLFQVETVAQVKENKTSPKTYAVSSSFSSIMTKNTSDKELKKLEKIFTGENHKLIISKVKRNKNNEIIAIKLVFDSGNTYVRVFERKSTEPITNIKIYVDSDSKDEKTFGFEEVKDVRVVEVVEVDDLEAISVEGFESDKKQTYWSFDTMKKNGKDVVLIINGKIKGATEKVKIPFNEELGDIKEITHQEFEKKYKQKADKSKEYFEVETIKLKTVVGSYDDNVKTSEVKNYKVTSSFDPSDESEILYKIKENKNVDYKKALIYYDGKEISLNELDNIKSTSIASVASMTATEYAYKKYGERAKNGVLIIESKEYFEKNNPIYKSLQDKKSSELDKKKEIELKAQQNSKLSKEEIEIRVEERKN